MKNSKETLEKRNKLRKHLKETIDPNSFSHYIEKECKDCGELKKCKWNSSFSHKGKPQYIARCTECQKKYLKKIRNTDKFRETRNCRRKKEMVKRKKEMVDYLGGSCIKCGYNKCLSALTFHHRNPIKKEFALGQIKDNNWNKIKKELDKCDLVCFNCHMEIHEKLNNK